MSNGNCDARALVSAAVPAVLALCLLPLGTASDTETFGHGGFALRSERESLYGWVRVIDQRAQDLRLLTSDASVIGAASISNGEGRLAYQDIVELIPELAPGMHRALVIGLGAGHMPRTLNDRYGIVTDTLEIDPAVADAAEHWFGFKPSGLAIVGDARYEMRRLQGPYDLIIHDCFTGGAEPAHLLTMETLRHLRSLLAPKGILALNFVAFAQRGHDPALASVARTLGSVFPHYTVFVSEPGKDFNDYIFLAANDPINLNAPVLSATQVDWLKERVFAVDPTQGFVLTDDFNPLEHLQTRKAEHYRRFVADWLGADLLVR